MSQFTAKRAVERITALAAVVLLGVADTRAEPPAAAPGAVVDASPLQIRYRGRYTGIEPFSIPGDAFRKSHPEIAVQYDRSEKPSLEIAKDLIAGRLDVATLAGPEFDLGRNVNPPDAVRRDLLLDLLDKSKCEYAVIGRRALAVVIHPQNPLREIDQAQAAQILGWNLESAPSAGNNPNRISSWKIFGQEDRPIQITIGRRAYPIIHDCISTSYGLYGDESPESAGLAQIGRNPWRMGFAFLDQHLAASGLKILPVRPIGCKEAVQPSPENVQAGKYPFFGYLLIATRPGASAAVREFYKTVEEHERAHPSSLGDRWLAKLDYVLPGEARAEVWPAPDDKAAVPAVSGAVAVLPLENLSAEFVMAGSSHHAAYEQAVADAIAKDGRLSMVDRAELARVFQEHKLMLAQGVAQPPRAIIAADVLVLSYVVTMDSRSYLLVQAFHAATTSCLGRMRLPIDPARPEEFMASIAPKTARWWPGVLRNLAAALNRPVWRLLPSAQPKGISPELIDRDRTLLRRIADVQAAIDERLAADRRVFYARPDMISDAQREVLMELSGMSRSAAGRFTPMADYIVQSDILGEGRIHLQARRGSDLRTVCEKTLEGSAPAATAADWIAAQLAVFVDRPARMNEKPSTATHSAAAAQAALELQTVPELRRQLGAFNVAVFERWQDVRKCEGEVYLAEDWKEVRRIEEQINRRLQRAAQLDPTCEATAYEALESAHAAASRQRIDACTCFLDTFPHSKHAAALTLAVSQNYTAMAQSARDPRGLESEKLAKEHWKAALVYMIRHWGLVCSAMPNPNAPEAGVEWTLRDFQRQLEQYAAMDIPAADFEEVAAEYSRVLDAFPEIVPSGDFQRLHYFYCLTCIDRA